MTRRIFGRMEPDAVRRVRGRDGRPARRGPRGRLVVAALLVGLLSAQGCDSGPEGPGALSAVATGPSLGGVVLQVEGRGIRGFSGRGSTRAYSSAVQDRPGVHRVILIDPEPGELGFAIEVDDRAMEGPVVTVISAADGENLGMPASRVEVRLTR